MEDVAVKIIELPEKFKIPVRGVEFSPDGKYLAVRSADNTINIWDWQKAQIVQTLQMAPGANDGLTTEKLKFSPDGRWFVSCHDRAIGDIVTRVWRTDTWAVQHDILDQGPSNAMAFTPDGKSFIRLVTRMPQIDGDTLIVYDTSTWLPRWGMRTVPFYTYTAAISPDSQFIALGGEVSNPRVWSFKTPVPTFGNPPLADTKLIAIVDLNKRNIVRTMKDVGVINRFGRLAWSPDGSQITNAGGEGLQIFDAQSGQMLVNVVAMTGTAATSLRYSPNGKYLFEGVENDRVGGWGKIWDGQHQKLLQDIKENVSSIAVSNDGRYLATGVNEKTIIWQLK